MKEQQGPLKEQHGRGRYGKRRPSSRHQQETHRFGNYDLVRRIDVGGMGEVYLARQRTAFDREVAIKILRADLARDETARRRFKREAEVSAHIKHEHILPLFEFGGEDQERMFLVTPYIAGGTLAQRLQQGPLTLTEVYQLFTALVKAVAYIHKRGVIHRDLKPGNILLDKGDDGQVYVRLIDFGIASILGSSEYFAPTLTQSESEMATIEYMAPERLDRVAAPSNDIYSLGIILYEMLTGERPLFMNVQPLPSFVLNRLSSPMRYVFEHCTYEDPNKRFPSADKLLDVFEKAYKAVITPDAPPAVPVAPVAPIIPVVPVRPGVSHPRQEDTRRMSSLDTAPAQPAPATRHIAPEVAPTPAVSLLPASQGRAFTSDDYNAHTTSINVKPFDGAGQRVVPSPTPVRRTRRTRSLLVLLPFVVLLALLLLGSVAYVLFLGSITATVNVSPQVHTVTNVLTIQAKPGQRSVDSTASTVPAYILNSSKSESQTGNTTGIKCTFAIFNCKPAVSITDVATLAGTLRQKLEPQIQQDLRTQAQADGATTVGNTYYVDSNIDSNPTVGAVGNTVTVTLTEQGSVEYIKSNDVQSLARTLLTQQATRQYGSGYTMLDSYTHIGDPGVQGVDANGVVTVKIAVGSVVEYSISPALTNHWQNALKGKKQGDASSYLARQTGLDPNSIVVHVSYGDTLPNNIQQIHIVPVNPTNIPPVQLPSV
jgi:serine/threonine protein kinase